MLIGWLVGHCVGWLVGWCVGMLVCWCVGMLACWLVGWLVGWLDGWLVGWLVGLLGGWVVGWLIGWFVAWLAWLALGFIKLQRGVRSGGSDQEGELHDYILTNGLCENNHLTFQDNNNTHLGSETNEIVPILYANWWTKHT